LITAESAHRQPEKFAKRVCPAKNKNTFRHLAKRVFYIFNGKGSLKMSLRAPAKPKPLIASIKQIKFPTTKSHRYF